MNKRFITTDNEACNVLQDANDFKAIQACALEDVADQEGEEVLIYELVATVKPGKPVVKVIPQDGDWRSIFSIKGAKD